jgi:hypothetical protein
MVLGAGVGAGLGADWVFVGAGVAVVVEVENTDEDGEPDIRDVLGAVDLLNAPSLRNEKDPNADRECCGWEEKSSEDEVPARQNPEVAASDR